MAETILAQLQNRSDTAAAWTASNPVLLIGEKGLETDTGKWKWGDGSTAWSSLPYYNKLSDSETTKLGHISVTQAVDLDDMESDIADNTEKIDNSYALDLAEAYGYVKTADDGQDVSLWTASIGGLTQDTTNVKIGSGSIRLTENDAVAGNVQAVKNNISIDLSKKNNGETSIEDDYINVVFYASSATAITEMSVKFGQASTFSSLNAKSYTITSGIVTGWNYFKIKKSAFSTTGTGAWNGIQSMFFVWVSTTGTTGAYVSFQLIQLVKADPSGTYPNPLASQGASLLDGEIVVLEEFGEVKVKNLSPITSNASILYSDKQANGKLACVLSSNGGSDAGYLTWYADSSNYIRIAIINGELQYTEVVGGSLSSVTFGSLSILSGDLFEFAIDKNGSDLLLGAKNLTNNESISYKTKTTISIALTGALGIGSRAGSPSGTPIDILSASITQIAHAHHADIAEVAKSLTTKTQAGAFISDELNYGEFGLDTSNNRLYMKYSSTQVIYFSGTVV